MEEIVRADSGTRPLLPTTQYSMDINELESPAGLQAGKTTSTEPHLENERSHSLNDEYKDMIQRLGLQNTSAIEEMPQTSQAHNNLRIAGGSQSQPGSEHVRADHVTGDVSSVDVRDWDDDDIANLGQNPFRAPFLSRSPGSVYATPAPRASYSNYPCFLAPRPTFIQEQRLPQSTAPLDGYSYSHTTLGDLREPFIQGSCRLEDGLISRPGTIIQRDPDIVSLYPTFKVQRNPKKFFKEGRVFMALWVEPMGKDDASFVTRYSFEGKYGERVYSKVRRFLVIREGKSHCLAIPILTYNGLGVSKRGVVKAEHGIIYTGLRAPAPSPEELPVGNEVGMCPKAVQVQSNDRSEKLAPMSRINYGKIYTFEHSVECRGIGVVVHASLPDLRQQLDAKRARMFRQPSKFSKQRQISSLTPQEMLAKGGGQELLSLLVHALSNQKNQKKPVLDNTWQLKNENLAIGMDSASVEAAVRGLSTLIDKNRNTDVSPGVDPLQRLATVIDFLERVPSFPSRSGQARGATP